MSERVVPRKYRPSIGIVVLAVGVAILLLPLASLIFFRIYENQLVQDTESELIVQSAVLAATFKQAVKETIPDSATFGRPVDPDNLLKPDGNFTPVLPNIDLASDPILPQRPEAAVVVTNMDRRLLGIGEKITAIFSDAQRTTLAGMRLLDSNGVVIAGREEIAMSLAHIDEVAQALSGRPTSVVRTRVSDQPKPALDSISRGTGIRIFLAFPVIEGQRLLGVVYMSRTPSNIFHHMYRVRYRLILAGLLIGALTALFVWVAARTIVRPMRQMSDRARTFAKGGDVALQPLPHYGTRELAELGQSFMDMASALEKRSQYIREFATHVSHEFKTPLTGIRGATELLQDHLEEMEPEKRMAFIRNIDADAARLKALVDRLLQLARADHAEQVSESCDLATVVEGLSGSYPSLEISIEVDGSHSIPLPREMLEIIGANLFDNASQAGATSLTITLENAEDGRTVLFSDNGRGISPGNQDKIYDPFFTTRRAEGGTGLGLGIIRSLVEAQNGRLELRETSSNGTTFALIFAE